MKKKLLVRVTLGKFLRNSVAQPFQHDAVLHLASKTIHASSNIHLSVGCCHRPPVTLRVDLNVL